MISSECRSIVREKWAPCLRHACDILLGYLLVSKLLCFKKFPPNLAFMAFLKILHYSIMKTEEDVYQVMAESSNIRLSHWFLLYVCSMRSLWCRPPREMQDQLWFGFLNGDLSHRILSAVTDEVGTIGSVSDIFLDFGRISNDKSSS
ncbi:hypothetical protein Tco_1156308 [Tanacetum coccineum]